MKERIHSTPAEEGYGFGFAQYYLLAYNAHKLSRLKRTLELSLAYTLAYKHKTTVNKVFKKYSAYRKTKDGVQSASG